MLVLLLLHTALWCVAYHVYHLTADENSPIENAQLLVLLLGSVLYLSAAVFSMRLEGLLPAGLALLGVSFLLREVDVRGLGLNPVVVSMVNGFGRNLMLGSMWLVFLVVCAVNIRKLSAIFLAWVRSPAGGAVLLAGLFLFLGRRFDKNAFAISKSDVQFYEELFELNAYLLLLLSSMLSLRSSARKRRALHCIRKTDHGRGAEGESSRLADEV